MGPPFLETKFVDGKNEFLYFSSVIFYWPIIKEMKMKKFLVLLMVLGVSSTSFGRSVYDFGMKSSIPFPL